MDVIPGSYTVHCQGCQEREQMRWPSRDHQRRVGFFLCEEQFDLWRLLLLQEPLSVLLNCRSKAFVLSDKYTGQSSSSERYTHIKKTNKQGSEALGCRDWPISQPSGLNGTDCLCVFHSDSTGHRMSSEVHSCQRENR